jgi:hypothetical protein
VSTPTEKSRCTFAVFPFLKTSAPARIGGLTFRSTQDLESLTEAQAEHVSQIAEMLFLQDDLRIRSASYAIVPSVDLDRHSHTSSILSMFKPLSHTAMQRRMTSSAMCFCQPTTQVLYSLTLRAFRSSS